MQGVKGSASRKPTYPKNSFKIKVDQMNQLKPLNHPFLEIVAACIVQIAEGHIIFQKFTCAHCGVRQGIEEPNKLYKTATCQECGQLTNIEKDGCNFMLLMKTK